MGRFLSWLKQLFHLAENSYPKSKQLSDNLIRSGAIAPSAIRSLDLTLQDRSDKPHSYVMLGIVGDRSHSFGYHLSKNDLYSLGKSGDYSLLLSRDRAGGNSYPDFASAWDLGFNAADMKLVTNRLIAAAEKRDPRITSIVREFCGTTNGYSPHPYDVASNFNDPNNTEGWDSSHVTHVHISFYRDVSNDSSKLRGILDVICGKVPSPTPPSSNNKFGGNNKMIVYVINPKSPGYPKGRNGNCYRRDDGARPVNVALGTDVVGLAKATGQNVTTIAEVAELTWSEHVSLGGS